MAVTKKKGDQQKAPVIHELVVRNINRTTQDIGDYINSLKRAENVNFPVRNQLYDIYHYVELDPFYMGVYNKRMSTLLNKEICFKRKDEKEDESFDRLLKSKRFRQLRKELFKTKAWGTSGFEFIPGAEFEFALIPRKHIRPEKGVIVINDFEQQGIPYNDNPNLWVLGEPFDVGFLHILAGMIIYKRNCLGDYSEFIEIFGQPLRVIRYDANDEKTRIALRTMATEAGSALIMEIPKQADYEVLDGKTSNANGELQSKFLDKLDTYISVFMLGNTETTGNSNGGSLAKAEVQQKQQREIHADDMIDELQQLNDPRFLAILKSYGFNTDGGYFEYEEEVDYTEVKNKLDVVERVSKLVPVDDDYIYKVSRVPKPDNYDAIKQEQQQQKPPAAKKPDPNNPDTDTEETDSLKAQLKKLSFWKRLNALFSEAP